MLIMRKQFLTSALVPVVSGGVLRALLLTFLCGCAALAWADPLARAGRVADVTGEAWLLDTETRSWVPVERNQTLTEGDQVRTGAQGRLNVRIGSTSVWLDTLTELQFARLDEGIALLRMITGEIGMRLRTPQAVNEYRVQTQQGVIMAESEGLYRVAQNRGATQLATLQGRARFDGDPTRPAQRAWLRAGEQAEFWGTDVAHTENQPLSRSGFSAWLIEQDRVESGLGSEAMALVSPEMTGVEVLDQHGRWEQVQEYGAVWIPYNVASDWAPYRYGHWAWTPRWGWTWVDDSPWGFAPFHYGGWVQINGRWGWAPGRSGSRPIYTPVHSGFERPVHRPSPSNPGLRFPPLHSEPRIQSPARPPERLPQHHEPMEPRWRVEDRPHPERPRDVPSRERAPEVERPRESAPIPSVRPPVREEFRPAAVAPQPPRAAEVPALRVSPPARPTERTGKPDEDKGSGRHDERSREKGGREMER
jgi:hypothetical protein